MIEYHIQRMNVEDDITEKEAWKYEHSFDYHYGRTVGILTREFRHQFDNHYHRSPTNEESIELVHLLNENSAKVSKTSFGILETLNHET